MWIEILKVLTPLIVVFIVVVVPLLVGKSVKKDLEVSLNFKVKNKERSTQPPR